jgi:hypothetical protein
LLEQLVQGVFHPVDSGAGRAAVEVSTDLGVKPAVETPLAEVVQLALDVFAAHAVRC